MHPAEGAQAAIDFVYQDFARRQHSCVLHWCHFLFWTVLLGFDQHQRVMTACCMSAVIIVQP